MSIPRKKIPKGTRFEIFKRDSFTCQYCGRKAPDVILHVDHIHPISKGGTGDIVNLITSCSECNLGKSDKPLHELCVTASKMRQSQELRYKREQIQMIAEWQTSLAELENEAVNSVDEFYKKIVPGWKLGHDNKSDLRRYINKYGIDAVMSAFRTAVAQHSKRDDRGMVTKESAECLTKIAFSSLRYKELNEADPEQSNGRYAAGIARNRFDVPFDHREICISWARAGIPGHILKSFAATSDSWAELVEFAESYLEG